MSQSIIIRSINYDGERANIVFNPYGEETVINLGDHFLPFEFTPSLLEPPKEVYGTYTILVLGSDCPNFLNVPRPTPTPTLTPSVTRTQTPTVTPTITPTPTFDPCKVPTHTPTETPTNTPTPTMTLTPSQTCTNPCGCPEPSKTPKPRKTPTPTPSITSGYCYPTPTPTPTPTLTPTLTITPTPTNTMTPTTTPTPTPYRNFLISNFDTDGCVVSLIGSNFSSVFNFSYPIINGQSGHGFLYSNVSGDFMTFTITGGTVNGVNVYENGVLMSGFTGFDPITYTYYLTQTIGDNDLLYVEIFNPLNPPTPTPTSTITPTPTDTGNYLLQSNGFFVLQADGSKIIIT